MSSTNFEPVVCMSTKEASLYRYYANQNAYLSGVSKEREN